MSAPSELRPGPLTGAQPPAAHRRAGTSSHRRGRAGQAVIVVVLSVVSFVGLVPFLFMLLTSFKTNQQYFESFWRPAWPVQWGNYAEAWDQINPYFVTTLIVAAGSTVGALVLCTVSAFVLARYQFP
ncbi:MAG: hypothetical protein ABWY56_08195, partial [Propionibacteriaceae bacterium]